MKFSHMVIIALLAFSRGMVRFPALAGRMWYTLLSFYMSLGKILETIRFEQALMMMRMVLPSRHDYKIFWSIICSIPVDMVNYFMFGYWSSDNGGRNKMMFGNISVLSGIWMGRQQHKDIAASSRISSSSPIRMLKTTARSIFIIHGGSTIPYQPIMVK